MVEYKEVEDKALMLVQTWGKMQRIQGSVKPKKVPLSCISALNIIS